jgi:ElaB/YqjD/DUF883 family membrane-anchored ribosome-binding protein
MRQSVDRRRQSRYPNLLFARNKENAMPDIGNDVSRDKLVQDFKLVIADAEELLRATAAQAGEKVTAARERIQDRIHTAKIRVAEAEEAVMVRTREAARMTDEFVHDKPWHTLGAVAGLALLVGFLAGRS